MSGKLLGITVLGDFIVSEGPAAVLDNLRRVGATAVAVNPTVTAPADEQTGVWQPPADAGHSPRHFDRPLFGRQALWLRSGPSFPPRAEFYGDSPYRPRQANDLTEQHGAVISEFIDACADIGIEVYLQVGAAEPTGLRDEDRPRLPDGSLPQGRIADTASMPCPAVRAYNRAYAADLAAAYPRAAGFRIDWPEYPCYTPDEVLQDFSDHVAAWAEAHGVDLDAIRQGVLALLRRLDGNLTNALIEPLADRRHSRAALRDWLADFPQIQQWLELKAMLSLDLIRDWRNIVDSLDGPPKKLSLHAFMPPFATLTGFDFSQAADWCDSLSPKFYTMHWCLMTQQWGRWLLQRNPQLDEGLLTRALVNLLRLTDEEPADARLDDFAYPAPDQPHPIGDAAQREKLDEVTSAVAGRAGVYPLVHGYGPLEDFVRRFEIGCRADAADGIWVNRYGYLSDAKLAAIEASAAPPGGRP